MKQDPKRQPAAGVFCCRLWTSLDYVRLESIYFLLTIAKMKAVNPPNLKDILSENFDEIAQYLYEKETISGEEFMRILNAQPQLPAGPSADSTNQAQ